MIARLRSWLRSRERQRELLSARQALDIFGVDTEGLSDAEVVLRASELNERIADAWREIEELAQEHVYSPLPPDASTEEIRDYVQGEIAEMEAFRDYLRARRLASERDTS